MSAAINVTVWEETRETFKRLNRLSLFVSYIWQHINDFARGGRLRVRLKACKENINASLMAEKESVLYGVFTSQENDLSHSVIYSNSYFECCLKV